EWRRAVWTARSVAGGASPSPRGAVRALTPSARAAAAGASPRASTAGARRAPGSSGLPGPSAGEVRGRLPPGGAGSGGSRRFPHRRRGLELLPAVGTDHAAAAGVEAVDAAVELLPGQQV